MVLPRGCLFRLIAAPTWEWVIAANVLLGLSQGFAWSMTVIMKIDLVGPKGRGLAIGLNEFSGYFTVGITAFLSGYLASHYGLRPVPIYLGVFYAIAGTILSVLIVRDTRHHVALEASSVAKETSSLSFRDVFMLTSFRNRSLFAASQAGLINNLNDGMSWGIGQVFTGPLSDRWGRKGLIIGGMWVQALGLLLTALTDKFEWWLLSEHLTWVRHRNGLSELDCGRIRCFSSNMARKILKCLSVLARSWLCYRGTYRRAHCRSLRTYRRNSHSCCSQFLVGSHSRGRNA